MAKKVTVEVGAT